MKKLIVSVFILAFVAVASVRAEDAIIKFTRGDEVYIVDIQNNRVVGGFCNSPSGSKWQAWGGAKDGDMMTVIFVTKRGGRIENWFSTTYRFDGKRISMVARTDKAGHVLPPGKLDEYTVVRYERM